MSSFSILFILSVPPLSFKEREILIRVRVNFAFISWLKTATTVDDVTNTPATPQTHDPERSSIPFSDNIIFESYAFLVPSSLFLNGHIMNNTTSSSHLSLHISRSNHPRFITLHGNETSETIVNSKTLIQKEKHIIFPRTCLFFTGAEKEIRYEK